MDLSKLSTEDLVALQQGDLSRVSTAGLQALAPASGNPQNLSGQPPAAAPVAAPAQAPLPLPDIPKQYQGGVVKKQDISGDISTQLAEEPWYAQAIAGAGAAPMEAYQGVKQLAGGEVSEADIMANRALTKSGAGMAGNIAGNMGMMLPILGPLEKSLRAAKTLQNAPRLLKALGLGSITPALAATETAITRPTVEGESRLEEAGKSAAFSKVGEVGLRALGRTLTGMARPSELGEELMKKGIQPTVGEGSQGMVGGMFRLGEDVLSTMGRGRGHELANRQAMDIIKQEITPLLSKYGEVIDAPISRKGGDTGFFGQAHDRFMDAYGSILDNKNVGMGAVFRTSTIKKAVASVPDASDETVKAFQQKMASIFSSAKTNTATEWKSTLNQIADARRKAMSTAGTEMQAGRLSDLYAAAEDALVDRALKSKALTPGEMDALKELGTGWAKLRLVESAALIPRGGTKELAGNPGQRLVSVDDLITASERGAPDAQKLREKEFFADITRPMSEVFERRARRGTVSRQLAYGTGAGLGLSAFATGLGPVALLGSGLVGAGLAGTTKGGSKVILGNTAAQKKLAEKLRESVYPRIGTISAALDVNDEKEE